MSSSSLLALFLSLYFALNFLCALVLHIHANHQAHLPVRFLDVLVHFVFLTAFGIPVLLVIMAEAIFGSKEPQPKRPVVTHAGARAA